MSLKPVICILAGGVSCSSLTATIPDRSASNYAEIPERNLFGLKPPPKIQQNDPPPQIPKIVLTGITTILGNKRALMKTQPQPAGGKQGEHAKELSLILTEGQREGDIEVLQIDEKAGSVKVNNSGTVMTLTFEKDGAKLPATPPPAPTGIPGVVGIPAPVTNQALNPVLTNVPGLHPLPTRNFRLPRSSTTPNPGEAAVAQPPIGGVPTPTGAVPVPAAGTQPSDLTQEEQAILQQIQREAASPVAPLVSNVPAPAPAPPVLPQ
jgi:hypothetical protein